MKKTILLASTILVFVISGYDIIIAQNNISWLDDYTGDIIVGSNTYNYAFTTVNNNDCMVRIEEKKTSKKGKITTRAYSFYLSDLDLSVINFKTLGSNTVVNLDIRQSQKFISVYSQGELSGYTNGISVYLNEVDKARSFIEAIQTHSGQCKEINLTWSSNKEVLDWLSQKMIESTASGTTYKQSFSGGPKEYLVQIGIESTDSKGVDKSATYDFNLSDINPDKINLVVAGKHFKIVVPTRENKYYIRSKDEVQKYSYIKNLELYSDEIEQARNLFNALLFLANNSSIPARKEWDSYQAALNFVKESISTVKVSSSTVEHSLEFDDSPSGMVHLVVEKTDAKGIHTKTTNSLYLSNLNPDIKLNTSARNISFDIPVRDKMKYIRKTDEEGILPYSNTIEIYESDIETARELINALESAIEKSEEGILDFESSEKSVDWLAGNVEEVRIDATVYDQSIKISAENENRIELSILTTTDAGETSSELFKIYPEDLLLDDIKIKVTGKKLMIPVSTGREKYIKTYKNEVLQNYTTSTEILFDDVQKARNFISAIKVLHDNSYVKNRLMKDKEAALSFLIEHVKEIEVSGKTIKQQLEKRDDNDCKMSLTTKTTDNKGMEIETRYEFTITDIDPINSHITVSMNKLMVDLITIDKEKLIKPFKNGEEGNFVNRIEIHVDDILVAKKILGAFSTLCKICE